MFLPIYSFGILFKQLQELKLDALNIVFALADQFILFSVYVSKSQPLKQLRNLLEIN